MASDLDTLVDMGFSRGKAQKALKATNGAGLQPAMDWILSHPEVSDEPDEEVAAPQALGTASTEPATPAEEEEGEIQNGEQTANSLVCNDCQKLFRDAGAAERHAIRTEHQNFSESTQVIQPLTESEKKDKLQELKMRMAEKRALREEAEKKDRKQAEMIRRKAGQDMTAVKEEMEAKEIKKAFDMKKREKEQEKIAKAKIKAQIEQDKKERAAKKAAAIEARKNTDQQNQAAAAAAATAAQQPVAQAAGIKKDYNEARLQVRVPGSQPITHTFAATATLSEVYGFLQSQGCNDGFNLSTTFPRKTFGHDDLQKSLKELNLVPSAALVLAYI